MTEPRTLEPSPDSENWILLAIDGAAHYFPSFGKLHQTVNCWCQPSVEYDQALEVPMYSHNEVH